MLIGGRDDGDKLVLESARMKKKRHDKGMGKTDLGAIHEPVSKSFDELQEIMIAGIAKKALDMAQKRGQVHARRDGWIGTRKQQMAKRPPGGAPSRRRTSAWPHT